MRTYSIAGNYTQYSVITHKGKESERIVLECEVCRFTLILKECNWISLWAEKHVPSTRWQSRDTRSCAFPKDNCVRQFFYDSSIYRENDSYNRGEIRVLLGSLATQFSLLNTFTMSGTSKGSIHEILFL